MICLESPEDKPEVEKLFDVWNQQFLGRQKELDEEALKKRWPEFMEHYLSHKIKKSFETERNEE